MTVTDDCPGDLVRVDPAEPGLTRRRRGRGFSYLDENGTVITDPAEIARLRKLVIPPAWQDVWISPDPRGHIQVLGTDVAGRRQYRYHDDWRTARDRAKHDRVLDLGAHLVDVRGEVERRLQEPGMGREKVYAAAFRMLDIGVFRVGGEQYAPSDDDEDGTFGLATLRREHVKRRKGAVLFHYTAKGGVDRELALHDALLYDVVGGLLRRRGGGEELLAYKEGGQWYDIRSADLNLAVKELAGEQHSCKDLRTWNATVLAAVTLACATAGQGVPTSQRARKRMESAACKAVSEHLGNTPTVARNSYVDPRVLERFGDGRTIGAVLEKIDAVGDPLAADAGKAVVERAVVDLIRG